MVRAATDVDGIGAARGLFVLGTSHSVASVPMRERMHIDLDEAFEALQSLEDGRGVLTEAIPLTTCSRWEVYCVARDADRAMRTLRTLVARRTGLSVRELEDRSYVYRGPNAVRHLFRVASGLDSVVHGEAQILGQVRRALGHPASTQTGGPILHRLFQCAISAGKRVRTETEIGRGVASLAGSSLSLLRREAGPLASLSVLVLGAGDTGALMGRLLAKAGVRSMVIANRTVEHARALAAELGALAAGPGVLAVGLDDITRLLAKADIVVGAAAAAPRMVTPGMVPRGEPSGPDRTLYFVDLAHPRNFDPALRALDGVRLFDLDHVSERADKARAVRAAEAPRAEAIVVEEADGFGRWLRSLGAVPVLRAVRSRVMEAAEAEAARHRYGRSREDQEFVLRLARSLARTILHCPTVALREVDPYSEDGQSLLDSAAVLFGVADAARDSGRIP